MTPSLHINQRALKSGAPLCGSMAWPALPMQPDTILSDGRRLPAHSPPQAWIQLSTQLAIPDKSDSKSKSENESKNEKDDDGPCKSFLLYAASKMTDPILIDGKEIKQNDYIRELDEERHLVKNNNIQNTLLQLQKEKEMRLSSSLNSNNNLMSSNNTYFTNDNTTITTRSNVNNSNNLRNTTTTSTNNSGNSNCNNTHININIHNTGTGLFPCFDLQLQAYQDLFLSKAKMYFNALQQQPLGMYLGYCIISHQSLCSAVRYGQANHVHHPALAAVSMSGPFTQNTPHLHDLGFLYCNFAIWCKGTKNKQWLESFKLALTIYLSGDSLCCGYTAQSG